MKLFTRALPLLLSFLAVCVALPQSKGPSTNPDGGRYWDFSGADSGDCHLVYGRLTIYPTGRGVWDARVMTHHTNGTDIWHAQIAFNDASNHSSGGPGTWDSPGMQGKPSPEYPWHVDFTFDAPSFDRWYYAVPIFNC